MEKLVSIIIPVYNVEEYLHECVDSVLAQTYKNLEIYLVDDGSTDNSGIICDDYLSKDKRIKVIHKQNGGLSSARNIAMDVMEGEYVYFLDSDDYISTDMIEKYVSLMDYFDADIVQGTSYEFWGKVNCSLDHTKIELKPEVFSTPEAIKNMLMDEKLCHAAAGSLYKTSLFADIRFPIGKLYEDFATSYYVVAKANKIIYIDDKRCFYRTRPGSIMNSAVTEKDMVLLDIADTIERDMVLLYPDLRLPAIRKKLVTNIKLYDRILNTGFTAFPDEQLRIKNNVRKHSKEFLQSKEVRLTDKAKVYIFLLGKLPFYVIYKFSDLLQTLRKRKA